MPEAFTNCVKRGGKVRTKTISEDKYMYVCIPPGGGKGDSVAGEIHTKKRRTKLTKGK